MITSRLWLWLIMQRGNYFKFLRMMETFQKSRFSRLPASLCLLFITYTPTESFTGTWNLKTSSLASPALSSFVILDSPEPWVSILLCWPLLRYKFDKLYLFTTCKRHEIATSIYVLLIFSSKFKVFSFLKGTPLYMSPELVEEKPYDHTADLW